MSTPNDEGDVEFVDGDNGVIGFGRTILNVNLATPEAIAAGAIKVRVDLSPSDIGEPFHGRDWLGFVLADSNDPVVLGGSGALFGGGNQDSRVGVGLRNSGSAITRRGPANVRAAGNPSNLNEPIYDPVAYDAYVDWFDGDDGTAPGDPVQAFANPGVYTVELIIRETAPGNLFADNAQNRAELFIGPQGGVLTQTPFDPANPTADTFNWGNNAITGGPNNGDPTPGTRDAYLAFVANANGGHLFDNLTVSIVPEPTAALLALVGIAVGAARRRS